MTVGCSQAAAAGMRVQTVEVVLPGVVEPDGLQVRTRDLAATGRGHTLVAVEATGVSFAEQALRRGRYPGQPRFPFVPGVDPALVGRRGAALTKTGGWASRVLLPAADRLPVTDGLDAAEVETLVVNGITAWQMLHRTAQVQPGQVVLVHGANGGVGATLAQLARHHGVRVIGAARPHHHDALRLLGVDAVFDNLGGPTLNRSWGLLSSGGALVSSSIASITTGNLVWAFLRLLVRLASGTWSPTARRRCSTTSGRAT